MVIKFGSNWDFEAVDGSCGVDEGRFSVTVGVIRSGVTVVVLVLKGV